MAKDFKESDKVISEMLQDLEDAIIDIRNIQVDLIKHSKDPAKVRSLAKMLEKLL